MKPYAKYKDSGIKWNKKIPENWEVKKLKYLLKNKITDGPHETPKFIDEGIPFLSVDSIKEGKIVFDGCRFISKDAHEIYKKKCILKRNDILMGKAASIGKIAKVNVDFEFSVWSPLAVIKSNEKLVDPSYLEYSLKSPESQYQIEILCTSNTQKNISMDDIPRIILTLPDIQEQKIIVQFLDSQTQKIDSLIEKRKQMIELLNEERVAIINQAVTKGINPKAKMKDSGIEWIGKIPNSYDIKKIKYLVTKIGSGITPRGGAEIYLESGIPILRSQNIHFDGLKLDDVAYISKDIHKLMSNSKVFSGDVLINITGASIGRCYYIREKFGDANVNQHVCILRPNGNIKTKYLNYFLTSNLGQNQVTIFESGSGRTGLTGEALKKFIIPLPHPIEQEQIVKHIESETSKIDKTLIKIEKEIILLAEYKTALISEAVTGKIDVRVVA